MLIVDVCFIPVFISDREKYLGRAGQNVRQVISALPDIFSLCQPFSPVDDGHISLFILVLLVGHFMCIELCRTKCPAGSELSAGHQ